MIIALYVLYAFLSVYFTVSLLIAVMTYAIFLYEAFNHPEDTVPNAFDQICTPASGNPPNRLTARLGLTCLRCMAQSVSATFLTPLFYPVGLLLRLRQLLSKKSLKNIKEPEPERPPVVFIHGLYHNESAWVFFQPWLKKAGYSRSYLFHYRTLGNDMEKIADKLDATLRRLEKYWPGERPILVGHSMGGLVIRHFLAREGNRQRASGVVTLATPHRGSRLAGLGIGKLAHYLAFDGPQFQQLAALESPPEIPCHAIYSVYDNQVLPQRALLPPPGWSSEKSRPLSHVVILWNKKAAQAVIQALKKVTD